MRGGSLLPFRDWIPVVRLAPPRAWPRRAETFGSSGTLISRLRPVPPGRSSDITGFHVLSPPTGATSQQFASLMSSPTDRGPCRSLETRTAHEMACLEHFY